MERDSKGRFLKGQTPQGAVPISEGNAKEYQRKAAASRKKNKTIAEMLRAYLETDAGGGFTKGEALVMKAVNNHKDGKLGFKDLRDLARILGEDVLTIKNEGPAMVVVPEQAMKAIDKWKKKKTSETIDTE